MKLGITQYAASGDGTNFVEAAARLGLAGVEPYIGDTDSPFLNQSRDQTEQFRANASRLGIEIPSVCLAMFNGDASVVTASGFDRAVKIVGDTLRFTEAVGAKVMLLCTFVASHPDTSEKRDNLVNVVRAVEPLARKLGVKIGLETPLSVKELIEVIDAAASDHVGVYYDFGNALAMGFDPAQEIPLLGKRILAIHAKDSARLKLGGLHFGEGDVNLAAAMRATRAIGFDGWLVLETPGGDEVRTRKNLELLKQHLQA